MFTEWSNKKIIAISNYKISEDIELLSFKYDIIIRFNSGSNDLVLSQYKFYNHKTDLCVLSGWGRGYFGDFNGFRDKKILFSRPKYSCDIKYGFKNIAVLNSFEQLIIDYTKNISYIPTYVFYRFYDQYQYNHPSTGLITLFYLKKILNLNIHSINFYRDNILFNAFTNKKSIGHDIPKEKIIFKDLQIGNYII